MGQKLQAELEYEKAAARAAYFADNNVDGLQAMNDAQQLSTWAQLKAIQKAAQNADARRLMREFRSEFFKTQEEMSQAARSRNQERSWDEQRRAIPERLATRAPSTTALAEGTQAERGHLMTAVAHTDGGDVAVDARVDKGMTLLEARFRVAFAFSARGLDIPTGLNAQRAKDHPDIAEQVKAAGAVFYVTFEGRNVKVEGDPSLKLDEAVKQAIMREFGYDRARVDGIDVDQLLHSHAFLDLGSAVMFSKAMDARGVNLLEAETLTREGHEGQPTRTIQGILEKLGKLNGAMTRGDVKRILADLDTQGKLGALAGLNTGDLQALREIMGVLESVVFTEIRGPNGEIACEQYLDTLTLEELGLSGQIQWAGSIFGSLNPNIDMMSQYLKQMSVTELKSFEKVRKYLTNEQINVIAQTALSFNWNVKFLDCQQKQFMGEIDQKLVKQAYSRFAKIIRQIEIVIDQRAHLGVPGHISNFRFSFTGLDIKNSFNSLIDENWAEYDANTETLTINYMIFEWAEQFGLTAPQFYRFIRCILQHEIEHSYSAWVFANDLRLNDPNVRDMINRLRTSTGEGAIAFRTELLETIADFTARKIHGGSYNFGIEHDIPFHFDNKLGGYFNGIDLSQGPNSIVLGYTNLITLAKLLTFQKHAGLSSIDSRLETLYNNLISTQQEFIDTLINPDPNMNNGIFEQYLLQTFASGYATSGDIASFMLSVGGLIDYYYPRIKNQLQFLGISYWPASYYVL